MFQSLHDLGAEDSISFSFGGEYELLCLNVPNKDIRQFQDRVRAFPATPQLTSLPESVTNMFQGGRAQAMDNLILRQELPLMAMDTFS